MNIVLTSHRFYPDIGGIETITEVLANYFVRQGHQVRVVTGSVCNEIDDKFNFSVHRNPPNKDLLFFYNWADIIFQNNIEVRRLWPLALVRKPVVIGLQTWIRSIESKRSFVHLLKLLSLRLATRLIACSDAVKHDSHPRCLVIGNPYDDKLFRITSDNVRNNSIVFLGRLVSDKGAEMLLKAFSTLKNKDWSLSIIGDGPQKYLLESLASSYNIETRVNFKGFLKGEMLVQELNRHEIMVVPSLWNEPFGVVALEGMACGCAMLVSDGGGLPDAIGSAGLKFQKANQNDLNHKLQLLVDDANLRQEFRSNVKSHLIHHTASCIGAQYLSVLSDAYKSFYGSLPV